MKVVGEAIIEGDTNIEAVIPESLLVIVFKRYEVKVPLKVLKMGLEFFHQEKNSVEPGMPLQADTMIDKYPRTACIPVKMSATAR